MDEESYSTSQDSSNSREAVQMNNGVTLLFVNRREVRLHCDLCQTIYSPANVANRHLNLCRECELGGEETSQALVESREHAEANFPAVTRVRRYFQERRRYFEENRGNVEETQWGVEEYLQRIERRLEGLPRVIITEEHEKQHNGLECAICLDPLSVGSIVKQLPCLHFFHPLCIVPWLRVRESCPTCRYKLSPAFRNEIRQNSNRRIGLQEIVHQGSSVNSSSATSDGNEPEVVVSESYNETTVRDRDASRVSWFLFAAVPIVSLVGIALVECFQSLLGDGRGRGSTGHVEFPRQCQQQVRMFSSGSTSTRTSNSRENT